MYSSTGPHSFLTVFLCQGGLGEVILQTPFYEQLKEGNPGAQVDALVFETNRQILANNPCISHLYTYSTIPGLLKLLRSLPTRYRKCFILDKSYKSNYLSRLYIRSEEYVGFRRAAWEAFPLDTAVAYDASKHESFYYLDLIESQVAEAIPSLYPLQEDYFKADVFFQNNNAKIICLLAGGANNRAVGDEAFRRWPTEHYRKVAQYFAEQGFRILLIGSESDREINESLKVGFSDGLPVRANIPCYSCSHWATSDQPLGGPGHLQAFCENPGYSNTSSKGQAVLLQTHFPGNGVPGCNAASVNEQKTNSAEKRI